MNSNKNKEIIISTKEDGTGPIGQGSVRQRC